MRYGAILVLGLLNLGPAFAQPTAGKAAVVPAKPSAAEEALHVLVDRQDAIFKAAEAAGKDVDVDSVRRKLQDLAYDYENFTKRNPTYGPGYAAYGVMLSKISMRTESAAILAKADRLLSADYTNESARTPAFLKTWALVKNQLGNHVVEEGHPIEGATYYLDAIQLVPKEPLYHFQLGNLLTEARDDFIKGGQWTRERLDKAIGDAFRTASELAPDRIEYSFRYGQSFYDMEKPDWAAALKLWARLEEHADSAVERETMRLEAANVLIKQGQLERARAMLATVEVLELQKHKAELLEQTKGDGK